MELGFIQAIFVNLLTHVFEQRIMHLLLLLPRGRVHWWSPTGWPVTFCNPGSLEEYHTAGFSLVPVGQQGMG